LTGLRVGPLEFRSAVARSWKLESSLRAIFVDGQRVRKALLCHHDERNTVRKTPFFVGTRGIKIKSFVEQYRGHVDDGEAGITTNLLTTTTRLKVKASTSTTH
jgi:hypothetical protein